MAVAATIEARIDVLALAVECIASSLARAQAMEVATNFNDRLSRLLAERKPVSAEVDEALAIQVSLLFQALGR